MHRLVFALAVLLSACSGASRSRIAGTYAGSASAPAFTVGLTMAATENDTGHVSGTAEMRRGDIVIGYAVEGMRDGPTYRLAFMSDVSPDLVVRVRPSEGGARLEGTATGGEFVRAPLILTRQ